MVVVSCVLRVLHVQGRLGDELQPGEAEEFRGEALPEVLTLHREANHGGQGSTGTIHYTGM